MRNKIFITFLIVSSLYAETEFDALCKRAPEFARIHANPPQIETYEEIEMENMYRILGKYDDVKILNFARNVFISKKIPFDEKAFQNALKK